MLRVALLLLGLRLAYVNVLRSVAAGPILFWVERGFVPDVELRPQSGIRQADPLPPLLFDVITTFLI